MFYIAGTVLKETAVRLENDNKFEQNIAKLEKEQIIIKKNSLKVSLLKLRK